MKFCEYGPLKLILALPNDNKLNRKSLPDTYPLPLEKTNNLIANILTKVYQKTKPVLNQ
jgi:hypothetical protein